MTGLKNTAFIWDLDGTLIDSYGLIVPCLTQTFREFGAPMDPEGIHRYAVQHSAMALMKQAAERAGRAYDELNARFGELTEASLNRIPLMDDGREILEYLASAGAAHYVYTNRGAHSLKILGRLGITGFFRVILTSADGFPRKPAPDAVNYLAEKYRLDREHTYYVGDRALDIECAVNAGIGSILLAPEDGYVIPTGKETFVIRSLSEIRLLAEAGKL